MGAKVGYWLLFPNSTLSFYQTRKTILSSIVLNDDQKRKFTGALDHMKHAWLQDIEDFIKKEKNIHDTTLQVSDDSLDSIPDSYDPSFKMAELEVKSQSKGSGADDELASFKTFGISKYLQCMSMIHNV